jgi:hypothetical protein
MDLSNGMVQSIILAAIFLFFIAIAWLLAEFKGMKDEIRERLGINNETIRMRLQALERLTVYAERASIKNLVSRTPTDNRNVLEVQMSMLEELRAEYDYNASQQIYVTPRLWKGISDMKDQHSFIINQVSASIPSQAKGIELGRKLLEYIASTDKDVSNIILAALQAEAKKLMDMKPAKSDRYA